MHHYSALNPHIPSLHEKDNAPVAGATGLDGNEGSGGESFRLPPCCLEVFYGYFGVVLRDGDAEPNERKQRVGQPVKPAQKF